jgi:outer membrane protein assembly factor BamD (BamD/ComL family)
MNRVRAGSLALALVVSACTTAQPRLVETTPAPRSEWSAWLLQASQEATAGNYSVAERLLTDYGVRYPATPEAAEAMYWRALYKLDPSNAATAPKDAAVLLDGYLASGTTTHRAEAQTLRRVASALEAARSTASTGVAKTEVVKVDDKAQTEELARLRDELARANAELERIKRRLAQPKP